MNYLNQKHFKPNFIQSERKIAFGIDSFLLNFHFKWFEKSIRRMKTLVLFHWLKIPVWWREGVLAELVIWHQSLPVLRLAQLNLFLDTTLIMGHYQVTFRFIFRQNSLYLGTVMDNCYLKMLRKLHFMWPKLQWELSFSLKLFVKEFYKIFIVSQPFHQLYLDLW